MGMRSLMSCSNLELVDKEKFIEELVAKKVSGGKYKDYWDAVKLGEEMDTDYGEEGDLCLDINDWKIQGYWYESFCKWLCQLQEMGVRGEINLDCEGTQEYKIIFTFDGVFTRIGPQLEFDEKTDEYQEPEDNSWITYIVTEKGLVDTKKSRKANAYDVGLNKYNVGLYTHLRR